MLSKNHLNKILVSVIAILFIIEFSPSSYANSSDTKHIVVFGDSLSAAYGIDIEQGWVHLLDDFLNNEYQQNNTPKISYQISNASVSGETTTGGLARLEHTLQELKPDLVLLALGANDGLQGHPIAKISQNIDNMLNIIESNNTQVALFGISIPASYGPRYIDQFRNIFPTIATQRNVPFFDLYQEDFFLTPGLMQNYRLHPTAKAQPIVRDLIFNFLLEQQLL